MKISIVGMGALGLLYAYISQRNLGFENVEFVMDKKRAEKNRKIDFIVNGELIKFKITEEENATESDLVIVAVKSTGLESAISTIKKCVGKKTAIISVLNGISSEDFLAKTFGYEKIVHCVAQGMDAIKFTNEMKFTKMGNLHIGITKDEKIETLNKVKSVFDASKIPYIIEDDIMFRMWSKFMLNVGLNQTCMAYSAIYSQVLSDKNLFDTFTGLMREVIRIANAKGVNLTEDDLNKYVEITKTLAPTGTPSMGQDRILKRKSEVELFSGTVIKIADECGIDVPLNKMIYEKIQKIESEY